MAEPGAGDVAEGQPALGDWLLYLAARYLMAMLEIIPWRHARPLAMVLGDLAYLVERRRRKQGSLASLLRAFPGMSRREAKRILRASYRHFVVSLLDALNFARFAARWGVHALCEPVGFEKLRVAGAGRGIIFVTGHVGHWEVLGAASPLLGYPLCSVGRGFDNPLLDEHVRRVRQRTGQRVVGKRGALRAIVRMLRQGSHVGFLIDQDARRGGVFVDFFGRPASTVPSPARIALRTGAPLAFVYARRIPHTLRFRVVVKDVLTPHPVNDRDAETVAVMQRLTRSLEEAIREAPEEWIWRHRRWRTTPREAPHQ